MNIDDFITNNTPKKKTSIFDEHIEDINKLISLNYSQKQVIQYLKSKCKNNKGLSEANLSQYLKKNSKTNTTIKTSKIVSKSSVENKTSSSSTEDDLLNIVKNFR